MIVGTVSSNKISRVLSIELFISSTAVSFTRAEPLQFFKSISVKFHEEALLSFWILAWGVPFVIFVISSVIFSKILSSVAVPLIVIFPSLVLRI